MATTQAQAEPKPVERRKLAAVPAPEPAEAGYDASAIEVLEGLEPVRRRPGMYIGGTDERALHHLFAEVIDNSMDEAVAGHASFIEVELEESGSLVVTDNGRGIPVDPHPKFPGKSALEVIMTTLHAGGKFDSKVYETSGGLHGVGISVVNALSDVLEVEVARNQTLYRQTFSRGHAQGGLETVGRVQNRRGTRVRFHPDAQIFGSLKFDPRRLFKMARSKAYLFGGVEIRWRCAPSLLEGLEDVPAEAVPPLPRGLSDYLARDIEGKELVLDAIFSGKMTKPGSHGSLEWAVAWTVADDGVSHSYCNTIPTPEGGTHESGLRVALLRGLREHAERVNQAKRMTAVTTDDVMATCASMLSVFIREPEFQGQTKDKLATVEASRIVETAVRDAFDHWLAASPAQANKLLDWVIDRAEERLRRRQEKEVARKSATRKLRLPASSPIARPPAPRARKSSSSRATRPAARPSRPATAPPKPCSPCGKNPQRGLGQPRQARRQPAHLGPDAGARLRHRRQLPRGGSALRQGHHHDRRGRGRRPHRLAADHLLLPADAQAHRQGPPVSRDPAALPAQPGAKSAYARDDADKERIIKTVFKGARSRSAASRASAR